jgi:kinesin family protein 15
LDENVIAVEFDVRCQYLEIYNEVIMDLLDPTGQRLSLRETPDKGVYPENCTEKRVTSIAEVIEVMAEGARNRHVAATRMN